MTSRAANNLRYAFKVELDANSICGAINGGKLCW